MSTLLRPFGDSFSRRDWLRAACGTGLSFLLPPLTLKAAHQRGAERPKSLIVLWMAGGPSQVETWDPHPGSRHSGAEIKAIDTTVPGLQISEWLPQMAEQMHDLSVIRSLVSKEGDHERGTYYVQTGYRPNPAVLHPALTAVAAKFLPDSNVEIPMHVCLAGGGGFVVPRGGYLGSQFDAYRIDDPGRTIRNMQAMVGNARQQRRLEGLQVLSGTFGKGREAALQKSMHQQDLEAALTMMSSEQLQAFMIDDEPQAIRGSYGEHPFGRGCLVARRLIEQGVRAVQVTLSGFDTHVNNFEGQLQNVRVLDPAFASLMTDLRDRDLLDSTMVLCIGEFGRTPWLNPLQGRDHWPIGFSCVLGGGGMAKGVVMGQTDPDTSFTEKDKASADRKPPQDPVSVPDLFATLLTQMGLDPFEEIQTPIGRPMMLSEGMPVERLLGSSAG